MIRNVDTQNGDSNGRARSEYFQRPANRHTASPALHPKAFTAAGHDTSLLKIKAAPLGLGLMSIVENFQPTPMHVHWHVIPRYKEVKRFHNHEFIDQGWPKSAQDMKPNKPSKDILEIIRDSIKAGF